MTQFDLNDEQRQIQEMARAFTADAITPHAAEWDEKHIFPRDTIRSAAELGFGSIYVSEESGGIGLGRLEAALIMEAMAYGCPSTSAFISIHNMASWMIDRFGTQAVKDKYLPSLIGMDRIAMMGLDGGRLNIGACSLGGAQRCLDEAVSYTKERKQFGNPVAEFQNTQFMLADMETDLQAARMLLYAAAVKVTENAPDKTRFAAMAKRLATDSGSRIVDQALQLHGGYGYLQDYPVERFWRDLRVHSILEGTNQIMRVIIARDLLRQ